MSHSCDTIDIEWAEPFTYDVGVAEYRLQYRRSLHGYPADYTVTRQNKHWHEVYCHDGDNDGDFTEACIYDLDVTEFGTDYEMRLCCKVRPCTLACLPTERDTVERERERVGGEGKERPYRGESER
jgi:hypothetical protein